ncbi:bifunctional helix-turn-helix transcriptional regulator/GNAT family N-acetyltransferase [Pigmentiphaga soli]|uniref:Bifunctional helix-turn-helix transcriptional regulator/GNAT family N-acetyltransferase n=1 Tax=Pigmentiphaga soli TaxID=1007095 RepID=A0ABP8H206_9BURK
MDQVDIPFIDQIRAASRQIVRELGFMQSTLAATRYPPSAVHAILEVGARRRMTAGQLADCLRLEKSSVSRMVRKLIDAGELKESVDDADGRIKWLALTAHGRRTRAAIESFARKQVAAALSRLAPAQQDEVAGGLAAYAAALASNRQGAQAPATRPVRIESGYRPGAIGAIVDMHARFYARHSGFGAFFESKVAAGLADFAGRLERPDNGLWLAMDGERIAGSVAIDGEDLGGNQAHLRWFIVDDSLRGTGVGRRLLEQAVGFCDERQFAATQLWTFRGLDAARRLYEAYGFVLAEEFAGQQWGAQVLEQRFVRTAGG